MATREELLAEIQRRQSATQQQPQELTGRAAVEAELLKRSEAAQAQQAQAAQQLQVQQNQPEQSFADMLGDAGRSITQGVTDTANAISSGASALTTIGTAAVAEPVAGIAGLVTTPVAFLGKQLGLTDRDASAIGTDVINTVKSALTVNPNAGAQEVLQAIGESPIIKKIGEGSQAASQATGDFLADIGESIGGEEGRAIGGALGKTLVAGGEIALGGAIGKGIKSGVSAVKALPDVPAVRQADKLLKEAVPTTEQLKKASSELFDRVLEKNTVINKKVSGEVINKIQKDLLDENSFTSDTATKTFSLVKSLEKKLEKNKKLSVKEIDGVKKQLGVISRGVDKTDSAAASIANKTIDELYESVDLGKDFKGARNLSFRGFKSERIDKVLKDADIAAGGFEKGLEQNLRSILKSEKESKKFNTTEKEFMKDIVKGKGKSKILKLLSAADIQKGSTPDFTKLILGGGAGGALGAVVGGPVGAAVGGFASTILGRMASNVLEKVSKRNTQLLQELTAAGNDARGIAKAYIKNTPKKDRNPEDLTALLLKPEVNIKDLKNIKETNEIVRKAVNLSKKIKQTVNNNSGKIGAAVTAPLANPENKKRNITISKSAIEEQRKLRGQ